MNSTDRPEGPQRQWLAPALIIGAVAAAVALLVALSLRRPAIDAYPPDVPAPEEVGDRRIERTYTLEATHTGRWAAFDFSRGSAVAAGDPDGWDIAFRRFNVMTNGGEGFGGHAGIVDLGVVAFDSVVEVPASGYVASSVRADSSNAAIERWYDYGFTSHILRPKANVYAVRTADGRYAKLQILSYYCPGATPGCITFRYVYQGDGTRNVSSGPEPGTTARPPTALEGEWVRLDLHGRRNPAMIRTGATGGSRGSASPGSAVVIRRNGGHSGLAPANG